MWKQHSFPVPEPPVALVAPGGPAALTVQGSGSDGMALEPSTPSCCAGWLALPGLQRHPVPGQLTLCSYQSLLKPGARAGRVTGAERRADGSESPHMRAARRLRPTHIPQPLSFWYQDGLYTSCGRKQQYLRGLQKDHAAAHPMHLRPGDLDGDSEGPQECSAPFHVYRQGGAGETGWGTRACPAPRVGA